MPSSPGSAGTGKESDGAQRDSSDRQAALHRGDRLHLLTRKNRRNDPDRLTLRKYDPVVRRHVEFREERSMAKKSKIAKRTAPLQVDATRNAVPC